MSNEIISASLMQLAQGIEDQLKLLHQQMAGMSDEEMLQSRPATRLILLWMHDLMHYHRRVGKLFNRRKQPPIADDFTGAVGLCLEQFLSARGYQGCVRGEETTHKARGAKRPDVSVRSRANELVAAVECKTNLGWNRNNWQTDFEGRALELAEEFPTCVPYLCVMSGRNWKSEVLRNSAQFGTTWFCLSNIEVAKLTPDDIDRHVVTPIESMYLEVEKRLALP